MAKKRKNTYDMCHCCSYIRSANDAGGLDIHSVNAPSAASYAQTECKEASSAAH
jgi:hypothetical protein